MADFERLSEEELAKLSPAKQSALRFIYKKQNIENEKKEAFSQLQKIKREKSISDKKLSNAKKEFQRYDNVESVILALAGIPSTAEDRPNRIHAIECLFDVLNKLGDGKVGKFPFSALYNQIRPITLLYEYVRESTYFDADNKNICINGRLLYKKVVARIEEQKRLIADAEVVFAELEKEFDSNQ